MNDWVNVCFDVTVHWSICYVWVCSRLMALKFVRLCYITLIFICDCTCECDSILKSHHMLYYTTCRSALHLHHVISHEEWCESGPCLRALYSTVPYVLTIRAVRCVLTVRAVRCSAEQAMNSTLFNLNSDLNIVNIIISYPLHHTIPLISLSYSNLLPSFFRFSLFMFFCLWYDILYFFS